MGSYPGAQFRYGVDLGDEEPEWFTEELKEEHGSVGEVADHLLSKEGIKNVSVGLYGDRSSGHALRFLTLSERNFYAYDPAKITAEMFEVPGGVDQLKTAWDVLYPGETMPEPGWFLTLTYG